jgi:hypothetical protein
MLSKGIPCDKRTHLLEASGGSEKGVSKRINISYDGLIYGFLDASFLRVLAMFLCSWVAQFSK